MVYNVTNPFPLLPEGAEITADTLNHAMQDLFNSILLDIGPSNDFKEGIILGLIVKFDKLYKSCITAINNSDLTAFNILIRSYYEITITIRYILSHLDEDDAVNKFIIGDAMESLRNLQNDLNNKNISKNTYQFEFEMLTRSLEDHGLSIKDIPSRYPKSWHPTLSYKDIAEKLDNTGESLSIYEILYSKTSTVAHPNLRDILKWHIKKFGEDKPYRPIMRDMLNEEKSKVLLACTGLAAMEAIALSSEELSEKSYYDKIRNLHYILHVTFNDNRDPYVKYFESVKNYAEFIISPDQ